MPRGCPSSWPQTRSPCDRSLRSPPSWEPWRWRRTRHGAGPGQVLDVLMGPLAGLTASDIRRLGRALRAQHHAAGYASPPSDALIRELVLGALLGEQALPAGLPADDPVSVAVARLTSLLTEVRAQIEAGAAPQEVLWTLWTGGRSPHGWPNRLRSAALHGSRSAGHDLDAVMALVDAAERLAGRYLRASSGFAPSSTPSRTSRSRRRRWRTAAPRADAVRILTAHRAKGLEWDEVWIVGAEEGVARPPRARLDAAGRGAHLHRRRRRPSARRSARGGAAAVLRRLHARPAPAARHGDRREGRGR